MHASAIALVSNNAETLLSIGQQLKGFDDLGDIVTIHAAFEAIPPWPTPPKVLLAIDISGAQSLRSVAAWSEQHPESAVVLMTEEADAELYSQAMRSGIREIVLASEPPEKLYWVLKRLKDVQAQFHRAVGKVMTLMSCKGGGGATFLATNLAYALSETAHKSVLVLDLNLNFGDAALFVSNRAPNAHIGTLMHAGGALEAAHLDEALLKISPKYALLAAPDYPTNHPHIGAQAISSLIRLARARYDVVLIDVGRTFNELALAAFDLSDQIIPVFQTSVPNLRDGRRLMDVFRAMGYADDRVYPVVNRYERQAEITLHHLERALERRMMRTIPNHFAAVQHAVNQGIPILKLAPNSPVSKCLRDWAEDLMGASPKSVRHWMSRVLH